MYDYGNCLESVMSRRLTILFVLLNLCVLVYAQDNPYNPSSINYGVYPQLPYELQYWNRPESDDENYTYSLRRNPNQKPRHSAEEYFFNPFADAPWYVQFYVNQPRGSARLFKYDPSEGILFHGGYIHLFNEIYPQEKVYLHFDNTAYFSGETIWFKAFVVNATNLQRAKSTVLYVDLLSPSGVMLQRLKLKIRAGQADGSFTLVDESTGQARQLRGILPYPSGYYEIRAYTQHMMNFSPDVVFSRVLPVFEKPAKDGDYANRSLTQGKWTEKERPALPRMDDVNVTFYPEGGHLVRGVECRVAFKATDSRGRGMDGSLTFRDGGQEVTAVTEHDGMGVFTYTPGAVPPRARFTSGSLSKSVSLPQCRSNSYNMRVDRIDSDTLTVRINRDYDAKDKTVGLTVTCRGELYCNKIIHINLKQGMTVGLNTRDWPHGVCQLTLFTDMGEILATRTVFHSVPEFHPPSLSVSTVKNVYAPFEKIGLDFKLTDMRDGTPFRDRFCLSVRDAADYGTAYSENILTDLLLSSDLKGCISRPEYYFESMDEKHLRALDLLMMVQGWSSYSRYDWMVMSGNANFRETRRLEDSLSVNGWIVANGRTEKKMLKNGLSVFMSISPDGSDQVEWSRLPAGEFGYFGFNVKDYDGQADLYLLVEKDDRKKALFSLERRVRMRLERALVPDARAIDPGELNLETALYTGKEVIEDVSEELYYGSGRDRSVVVLPEVTIRERRRYVDYFTFHALDVEKDVETELDLGNYPPNVLGYLLGKGYNGSYDPVRARTAGPYLKLDADKGYTVENELQQPGTDVNDDELVVRRDDVWGSGRLAAEEMPLIGEFFLDGVPVFWYVHNKERYLYSGEYVQPWDLDTRDIEGILVFDEPATLTEIRESVPLYMNQIRTNNVTPALSAMNGGQSGLRQSKYYLIDVQVKEDHELLSESAKRNLGQRITTMQGFTPQRAEFYSPQYPEGPIEGDVDYRRTLYWNPNVITDSLGCAHVEFYNNSYSTNFTVTGAGITASGTPYVLDEDF